MAPVPKPSETSTLATDLVHGDALARNPGYIEVAPSISVTTTFRAPHPDDAVPKNEELDLRNPARHVYSRYSQSVSTRVEHILSKITKGYALTYSSGLAASFAAIAFYHPKRIAITGGYHGVHGSIGVYKKCGHPDIEVIGVDDEFREGDLCWIETPLNPTGEARDIKYYADKVHAVGGKLVVDATFGPPPLQEPFSFYDLRVHSGTKYFGGHSDLLSGVLVVKTLHEWNQLHSDRIFLGSTMGSLESWLLLRSLRTLHLRVPQQSKTATALVEWLNTIAKAPAGQIVDGVPGGIISKVWHSSIQEIDARGFDPRTQLTGGWNATFAILLSKEEHAKLLPHVLKYFVPATSLGGVESLIEQRVHSDSGADPRLVRLSIGVEDFEDLRDDLRTGLQLVAGRAQAKL